MKAPLDILRGQHPYAPVFADAVRRSAEGWMLQGSEYTGLDPRSLIREAHSSPEYRRGIYSRLAQMILPLFLANPHLWRIVRHIGDSRSYATLDELLSHLRRAADVSYRDSLDKMVSVLLP